MKGIQNILFLDYFFYEDASDEQKTEGTLLPLWNFVFKEIITKMEVTALAWNPKYRDLFAVGFGSCEYELWDIYFNLHY